MRLGTEAAPASARTPFRTAPRVASWLVRAVDIGIVPSGRYSYVHSRRTSALRTVAEALLNLRPMWTVPAGRFARSVAKSCLEGLLKSMEYEYRSEFTDGYVAQGIALGEAKAVVAFLDTRGIEIPDEARARITECTDVDQLEIWVPPPRRSTTCSTRS
jgi:hypothetical protein